MDFGGVLTDPGETGGAGRPLLDAVVLARRYGIRTALLSNADGLAPGEHAWTSAFDALVLSGEIGFAKPDPRIYLVAAELIGLIPEQCVFVDDQPANVRGAVRTGMIGVHHTGVAATIVELGALFEIPFGDGMVGSGSAY
jgi:FMN phosphatase YigB (HAD superfamily)